jgi:hypothetical protein
MYTPATKMRKCFLGTNNVMGLVSMESLYPKLFAVFIALITHPFEEDCAVHNTSFPLGRYDQPPLPRVGVVMVRHCLRLIPRPFESDLWE